MFFGRFLSSSCRATTAAPPATVETPTTVSRLPPEVLLTILSKVKGSRDLYACSQSSQLLHQLLDSDKQRWCFDLLLPHLLPHLNLQDLLNCRLVCGTWQESVDTLIQNWSRPCTEDNDRDHHPLGAVARGQDIQKLTEPLSLTTRVVTRQLIEDLVRRFQGCRIVGDSVLLGRGPWNVAAGGDYWGSVWIFLKSFGPQIGSLTLDFHLLDYSATELFALTQPILRCCPNVRKIQIGFHRAEDEFITELILEGHPLPPLPHLESLVMKRTISQPLLMYPLLERYGPQLKWLEFDFWSGVEDATLRKLTSLTELAVRPSYDFPWGEDPLRRLLEIPSRHLQKLTLELSWTESSINTLLQLCDRFPLKSLSVSGSVSTRLTGQLAGLGARRTLKSLEFMDVVGVESFDFLECFPSLEYLHLKGAYRTAEGLGTVTPEVIQRGKPRYGVRSGTPETVEVRRFLYPEDEQDVDRMYRSNLWLICPRLKKFVFEWQWIGPRFWRNEESQYSPEPDENSPRVFTRQGLRRHQAVEQTAGGDH